MARCFVEHDGPVKILWGQQLTRLHVCNAGDEWCALIKDGLCTYLEVHLTQVFKNFCFGPTELIVASDKFNKLNLWFEPFQSNPLLVGLYVKTLEERILSARDMEMIPMPKIPVQTSIPSGGAVQEPEYQDGLELLLRARKVQPVELPVSEELAGKQTLIQGERTQAEKMLHELTYCVNHGLLHLDFGCLFTEIKTLEEARWVKIQYIEHRVADLYWNFVGVDASHASRK